MDAITLLIEAVGVVILMMWIVIPIREFMQSFEIVKHKPHAPLEANDDDPQRGFPTEPKPPQREDGTPT